MPLYEYRCEACGEQFEVIRKFADAPLDACVRCGGGPVHRLLSSPAIQFKGSGWYITDYAQKGKSGSEAGSDSAGASNDGKSKPAADDGASGAKTGDVSSSKKDTTGATAKPAATE